MTRTSISVPAGLKARMGALNGKVNWSRVACRAFAAELKKHDPQDWRELTITVVGDAPLVCNRFHYREGP